VSEGTIVLAPVEDRSLARAPGFALDRRCARRSGRSAIEALVAEGVSMRILDALVEMVALVHGLAGKVARQDADSARQMKRPSSSAALNASEGIVG
jgi:hypothetical protein